MPDKDVILTKFHDLYKKNPRMGVTLKELDGTLIADGVTVEVEALRAALDPNGLLVESVRDGEGNVVKRGGLNVWQPRSELAA